MSWRNKSFPINSYGVPENASCEECGRSNQLHTLPEGKGEAYSFCLEERAEEMTRVVVAKLRQLRYCPLNNQTERKVEDVYLDLRAIRKMNEVIRREPPKHPVPV